MESNMFALNGRLRRSKYWGSVVVAYAVIMAAQLIMTSLTSMKSLYVCYFIILSTSIFSLIQGIKRMHDVNKSGWYILIPIYSLILTLTDSTTGYNKYGNNPKEVNPEDYDFYDAVMLFVFAAFAFNVTYAFMYFINYILTSYFRM